MPEAGEVTYGVADNIARITFGHPKGNSLPGTLLAEIAATVKRAASDPEARVVVLQSVGSGAFCAGASFDELRAIRDAAAGHRFFMGFANVILTLRRCPKFVIARVHGKAVGGGVGLVAASDYAIAVESAAVKLSELAVGIGPFVVGPAIERKIGAARFMALAVDATRWRDAEWARASGLYAEVCPDTGLDAAVDGLAARLASANPDAMAEMKAIFWAGTDGWDGLLADRAAISGRLVLSPFTQQAIGGA